LSVAEIGKIATILKQWDVATVKLSGGEPTVREDLPQILAVYGRMGIRPVVITNGIRIADAVFAELRMVGGELKFSVHRPDISNDLVFAVPSFPKMLANISTARDESIPFSINTVVTPATIDIMRDMVDFAARQNARKISFMPVVPRGKAKARIEFEFDGSGLAKVHDSVEELSALFKARIDVRCIDIRARDYWIVENDGSLWIERARDDDDVLVYRKAELMRLFADATHHGTTQDVDR
jgi:molybdenum cofactor biosynthesis enzyme MoaA